MRLIAHRARPAGRGRRAAADRLPLGQLCRQCRHAGGAAAARPPPRQQPQWRRAPLAERAAAGAGADRPGRLRRPHRGPGEPDRRGATAACGRSRSARCRRGRCGPRCAMPAPRAIRWSPSSATASSWRAATAAGSTGWCAAASTGCAPSSPTMRRRCRPSLSPTCRPVPSPRLPGRCRRGGCAPPGGSPSRPGAICATNGR